MRRSPRAAAAARPNARRRTGVPVGVVEPGSDVRGVDHLAVRRSASLGAIGFAAGAGVALVLWLPVQSATDSWAWPYSFVAHLWWTLPLSLGAAGVWTVMFRARYQPVTRSS
ncbi:hypothetical protein GCM10027447_03820 [Glycomyces halotolerans]